MTDIFLKKFFDHIKDPTWPEINDCRDVKNLNVTIKQECLEVHGLEQRLNQIENSNYWALEKKLGIRHQNLMFLPLAKCASTYYTNLFVERLRWDPYPKIVPDTEDMVFFGCCIHPITRYLKGITEFASMHRLDQRSDFDALLEEFLIPDEHSLPYSMHFGRHLHDIHWIPIDILEDNDVRISMMNLFKKHGHRIDLPLDDKRLNVSTDFKNALFQRVRDQFMRKSSYRISAVYSFLADDLAFYRQLIDNFRLDWDHIKSSKKA